MIVLTSCHPKNSCYHEIRLHTLDEMTIIVPINQANFVERFPVWGQANKCTLVQTNQYYGISNVVTFCLCHGVLPGNFPCGAN